MAFMTSKGARRANDGAPFVFMEEIVTRRRPESSLEKIFENLNFLVDVFGDKASKDIPDVPFLDLARSFELSGLAKTKVAKRGK